MTDSLHVYLNATRVMARRRTWRRWRPYVETVAEWEWNAADVGTLDLAPALVTGCRALPVHVCLGGALVRLLAVDMPDGVNAHQERLLILQAQMAEQMGLEPGHWQCALDAPTGTGRTVGCAVAIGLMARLREQALLNGGQLYSVRPLLAQAWNAFGRELPNESGTPAGLLVVEHDAFSVLVCERGSIMAAASRPHQGAAGYLRSERRRLELSYAISPENMLVASHSKTDAAAKGGAGLRTDFGDLLSLTKEMP